MNKLTQEAVWIDNFHTSQDGLKLYSRLYPALQTETSQAARPVLCLPGLTRNSNDFHVLALHLSQNSKTPRDVYCLDYRGRGRSGYDTNWRNYSPYIELLDTLDFMTLAELHHVTVLGTSRGGIIAMLMAVTRPSAIGSVIFNDIGPVVETRGLARIIGYVGKTPAPDDWEEAALIVRDMSARFFTDVSDDEWMDIARQLYMDKKGQPVPGYDPALANALSEIDLASPTPQMWPQFDALKHVPMLVLRGENTDVLSQETVDEMAARHPGLQTYEVQEEGHAPLLRDRHSLRAIDTFLASTS